MSKLSSRIERTSKDFFYNILASVILTGIMQVLVYPSLARWVSISAYGVVVTAMGIINTLAGGLGASLNNTRLIMNSEYNQRHLRGDFNLLMSVLSITSAIALFCIGIFYLEYDLLTSLIIGITSGLMVCRQYFIVDYRLVLNFKKVLISNTFGAIGYIVGLVLFFFGVRIWAIIFLCSEVFSITYVFKSSAVWKEPFTKTVLFSKTTKKVAILLVSILFANMLTYFDRIFLYPTLGSETVSIYTVASFFGKSLAIVMTPISGVLLGYFAQDGYQFDNKKFFGFNLLIVGISFAFALIAMIISPFFTKLLYPSIFESAKSYVLIANTAAIIAVSCNMLQTVILKFSPTYYQIYKEGVYAIVYFGLSFLMMSKWGLWGFCIAALISNLTKYLIITCMGVVTFNNENRKLKR